MVLFSKKIQCTKCGKKFKSKKERNVRKYVCSTYDNYKKCERSIIKEDFILELLERRFGKLSHEELSEKVIKVKVHDKKKIENEDAFHLEIELKNDDPIILNYTYLQL